jgi:imidazolonepropionase-like amidohydrolase
MPQHFDLILKNGTCVLPWGETRADIGLRAGKIAAIGDLRLASATQSIDCAHLHVLPGMIDAHVHLRDPGDASLETLESGTKAALRLPDGSNLSQPLCRAPCRCLYRSRASSAADSVPGKGKPASHPPAHGNSNSGSARSSVLRRTFK